MDVVRLILLLIAAVCFALSAFWVRTPDARGRVDLLALGLLCWVMVPLIDAIRALD
jgi:hypothetical protein